jgi:hypothetical protein
LRGTLDALLVGRSQVGPTESVKRRPSADDHLPGRGRRSTQRGHSAPRGGMRGGCRAPSQVGIGLTAERAAAEGPRGVRPSLVGIACSTGLPLLRAQGFCAAGTGDLTI